MSNPSQKWWASLNHYLAFKFASDSNPVQKLERDQHPTALRTKSKACQYIIYMLHCWIIVLLCMLDRVRIKKIAILKSALQFRDQGLLFPFFLMGFFTYMPWSKISVLKREGTDSSFHCLGASMTEFHCPRKTISTQCPD